MFQLFKRSTLTLFTLLFVLILSTAHAKEPALAYKYDDKRLQWGPCPPFIGKGCEIAVLHGDPSKNNVDIFFKVPGDFSIPHHWHTSAERMALVSGTMTVTYDDQASERLEAGMYAYGPSRRPHTAYCEKGDPCVLFIAFEEPLDAFEVMKATK
jgi:mannose-6-phosphate isomerase-like protein (cupin superfamily)